MKFHGETEPAAFARADADVCRDLCIAGILFLLLADEIEGATEASGISSREKMLGRSGVWFSRPTHGLWDRKIRADRTVARLSMTVSSAGRGCRRSEERLDTIHDSGSDVAVLAALKKQPIVASFRMLLLAPLQPGKLRHVINRRDR
jgi:hypothetical protein